MAAPMHIFGSTRGNKDLVVLGCLMEFGLVVLLAATGLDRGSYLLEVFFWLPFAIYLFTIWRINRRVATPLVNPGQTGILILFFALLFHATLLFSASPLSNDVYRYNWDGKVLDQGLNPYAYSPDADLLSPLRDATWERVMNQDVHTMYPPLAEVVFAAAYAASPGTLALRLLSISFDLLAIGVLILILRRLSLDVRYSIVYAWSPLATIESANSGHIDPLAILLTLLAFLALLSKRRALSAAVLALAVLSKVFPLLFTPLFFPRWGKKGTAIFAAVIVISYLPFLGAGADLLQGSSYFVDRGLFNGSIFPLLLSAVEGVLSRPEALRVAKALVVLTFICLVAFLSARLSLQQEDDLRLWKYSFWLTGAFLLLTPTLHPWYLTWILPFLCFFRSPGWILLTGSVILARSAYIGFEATGVLREVEWIRFAEYAPPYLLLLWGPVHGIGKWAHSDSRQPDAEG
jgi:alpha-1,6-mannosyltransferase